VAEPGTEPLDSSGPSNDDPWEAARASQRADVQAVFARRERLCPNCGAAQRGAGRRCPNCGADLTARLARWHSLRRFAVVGLAALVLGAAALPFVAGLRDDASRVRARAAERQQALEAAERARLIRDSRPVRAAVRSPRAAVDPLVRRVRLLRRAESLIATDARKRVAAGTIKGKIRGASCSPYPATEDRRAAEQDPATPAGRYDCVAYTSKFEASTVKGQKRTGLFGYPYWLVIDYADSGLVWCKVNRGTGEAGSALASVSVPKPCRDPAGPG
jgi:hypothetical protein